MDFINNNKIKTITVNDIKRNLLSLSDEKYKYFICPLIPTIASEKIIGIRTPTLKKYAKAISQIPASKEFLNDLPHEYLEENNLHSFMIMEIKDIDKCLEYVDSFLPYVDNWAVCDSLRPKCFKNHKKELLTYIERWILSPHCYSVRFAIEMLMLHFLEEDFSEEYFEMVESVNSDEYYVKMMVSWFFATALSKRFDETFSFLKKSSLDHWTYNKAIQKACESHVIKNEQKELLRKIKRIVKKNNWM